ncbi:Ca(2+)/Mn(2+)-transporting P-type ATPase PMR1 [Ascoidea rubescens DSM 1968]|uniref:Calcium-transporting P n=1 Tax=Ascoidea rubescens DSM 1968 TaxID=1344418 RepID=A0A1D2VDA8_9ASCO|nr:calcium-transporting P [Ascoidea rubescens DSM 1968]ODV59688.1 calcium-transporting P [Ascoidea rubescens DSM 1968]
MTDNPYLSPSNADIGSVDSINRSSSPSNVNLPSLKYATLSVEQTIKDYNSDPISGLSSSSQISYLQSIYGVNDISNPSGSEDEDIDSNIGVNGNNNNNVINGMNKSNRKKKKKIVIPPILLKFLNQFVEDKLILLLICSSLISLAMGNYHDSISIFLAIIIVITVGFIQEFKSENSLKELNKLIPSYCNLKRNNVNKRILANNLVPGDLVFFSQGDRIPADIRIINSVDLLIDESNLTGENKPLKKDSSTILANSPSSSIPINKRSNIAYMGTLVTQGHGSGIVVAIGYKTVFGHICKLMGNIEKPRTPMQNLMDNLGNQLTYYSFIIISIIYLIGIIQGKNWLDMFQISVSLAVAAIPEGLPIIVTVTLALGVLRMANQKAIVKRLNSVETLGSVNVICTDKTGTLTQNQMTITKIWSPDMFNDYIDIYPKTSHSHSHSHNHGTNNSYYNKYYNNHIDIQKLIQIANICNNSKYSKEIDAFVGNPTDIALINIINQFTSSNNSFNDLRDSVIKLNELSFNSTRKFQAISFKNYSDSCISSNNPDQPITYIKGAIEKILSYSKFYLTKNGEIKKLTPDAIFQINKMSNNLQNNGLRVIALAFKDNLNFKAESDIISNDFVFVGFVGMNDPPKKNVSSCISKFISGGVHVIMITGDSEITAYNIAKQIGMPLINPETSILTGDKLDHLNEFELSRIINHVSIFARTTPQHKVKIVKALQKRGDIVAMTGDGVNDAPALKLADIGIAMGKNGTDVAKEAADMILVNDEFNTILKAIEEGKAIFQNIQNFLCFQLSTSIAALGLISITTLFNLPNPLNPMMILFINIIMDGPPAQSLGVEEVDKDIMNQPPRKKNDNVIITGYIFKRILLKSFITILGTLFIYYKEMSFDLEFSKRDTTMTFTTFILFDLWNALGCKHSKKSIFKIGFFKNKFFNLSIISVLSANLLIIYLPLLQNIFQTESLLINDLVLIVSITSSVFIGDEIYKYFNKQNDLYSKYNIV